MKKVLLGTLLSLPLLFVDSINAQPEQQQFPPPDVFLLIQSELSHLEGCDLRVNVRFNQSSPRDALERIRQVARFSIEVEGELSPTPQLTASFNDTPVKEVLMWFAREVAVVYRAARGTKLIVLVKPADEPAKG